ncbi:MoaC-domain-containing protein [Decorospora gaudefroyi]|uniref:cyclic pyranopterin monophosphate synthase n=1 Tax=Decorospora gaudefroyi TaxID=184978 RepID=A0A6A5KNG9_9PLEO|nr:MoaC-domain-containing protein [Decorospora gaudefroyi]
MPYDVMVGYCIDGVLSVLLDYNMPLSTQDPRWHTIQKRSRHASIGPGTFQSRPSIYNTPHSYLQTSLLPIASSIRTFWTAPVFGKRRPAQKKKRSRDKIYPPDTNRPDIERDEALLNVVARHGPKGGLLPPVLEFIRQKYSLQGPEYDDYWTSFANSLLRNFFAHKTNCHLQLEKNGRHELSHKELVLEYKTLRDKAWRGSGDEGQAETEKPVRDVKTEKRFSVARGSRDAAVGNDALAELEKLAGIGEDATVRKGTRVKKGGRVEKEAAVEKDASVKEHAESISAIPQEAWRNATKHNIRGLLDDVEFPSEKDKELRRIGLKINELQICLAQISNQASASVTDNKTRNATEHVTIKNTNMAENEKLQSKRKRWRQNKKKQALLQPIVAELDEYKQQAMMIQEQARLLEDVRKRKEAIMMRKRTLLVHLEEQYRLEKESKGVTKSAAIQSQEMYPFVELDEVLEDAVRRDSKGRKEPTRSTTVLREDFNTPQVNRTENSAPLLRTPAIDALSVAPLEPAKDSHSPLTLGSTDNPEPMPPNWPNSQQPNRDIATKPQRPSDDSRLPDSFNSSKVFQALHQKTPGSIPIDEDFVVSFERPVPDLQTQVYEMQQRLKVSYPRIDSLPYNVWTSENERTLQTWLRILVTKWHTRFNDVKTIGHIETGVVNARVQAMLDHMVRDHDLNNESAERMAMRFHDVFSQRGAMDGDAEGVMDWDEMDAGGMGFLTDKAEHEAPQQEPDGNTAPLISQSKDTEQMAGRAAPNSIARRSYSTSSRPPRQADNAELPSSTSTPPPPSLPHLTPSGSAHMVSVSTKAHTTRTAIAVGTVSFTNPVPLSLIRTNSLKKGDVLSVSRIAGIMAAKKCSDLIPLCHPIPLTHVGVELRPFGPPEACSAADVNQKGFGSVMLEAKVQCTGPTGVEMEALTAVMGAALSVVDMCKAVDRFQRIGDVRIVFKEGGRSGTWSEEGWRSWQE